MGIRGIGKKMGEVAFEIAMSSCEGCGGDGGGKCQHCQDMDHLKGQGLKNTNETEEPLEQRK